MPSDDKIVFATADEKGSGWKKYNPIKRRLEAIGGSQFRQETDDFRNKYHHRFASRFMFGMTQFVTRHVRPGTNTVTYSMGGSEALQLSSIVEALTKERDRCYLAFDAFQELVREFEGRVKGALNSPSRE